MAFDSEHFEFDANNDLTIKPQAADWLRVLGGDPIKLARNLQNRLQGWSINQDLANRLDEYYRRHTARMYHQQTR